MLDDPLYMLTVIHVTYLAQIWEGFICMGPGRVAQSVGHLTHKSGVLGSIRSGNILSFLLPLFQEGQLSVTGESMCTKYWLTA